MWYQVSLIDEVVQIHKCLTDLQHDIIENVMAMA